MTKLDEIEARLKAHGNGLLGGTMAFHALAKEDTAYLLAEVKRLRSDNSDLLASADADSLMLSSVARERDEAFALHADALAGWNKSIDRVAELGAERNEARALALPLAEAVQRAADYAHQTGDHALRDDMNAALASPALLKLRGEK
jgi:hypothetical protein